MHFLGCEDDREQCESWAEISFVSKFIVPALSSEKRDGENIGFWWLQEDSATLLCHGRELGAIWLVLWAKAQLYSLSLNGLKHGY